MMDSDMTADNERPGDKSAWKKRGLVFQAPGTSLMRSHAMIPTPHVMGDRIRVFFSSCDETMRGRVFSVDLSPRPPYAILHANTVPALDLGEPGSFDEDGVNPCHAIERDGRLYLYYVGWQRRTGDVPYTLFTGLATSEDGGLSFTRLRAEPILPPSGEERYFRTAPHVVRDGEGWTIWYIGGGGFFDGEGGKRLPLYSLRRSWSPDGITWDAPSEEVLQPDRAAGEIGFGRPFIWQRQGEKVMLLSVRSEKGYVLSSGRETQSGQWVFDRAEILSRGPESWDTDMICFGAVCRAGAEELLFYNGNQFGRTGFGLATRPAED